MEQSSDKLIAAAAYWDGQWDRTSGDGTNAPFHDEDGVPYDAVLFLDDIEASSYLFLKFA